MLAFSGIFLLVLLVVLVVWGYVWLKGKEARMKVPEAQAALGKRAAGQPDTTLVMGVDKGSVPGEEESRADILMLISVNASGDKAAVISIPRDARVQIPGRKGYDKINAAHAYGSQALTIQTVNDFTGLTVNHFVEIDFNGFKEIVNAMGGVPMHIDKAIHDIYAGDVPAGDVVLNGDQALALVRARHDLKSVPGGDLDRIKNQRKFLQAMLSTISRQRNPFKVMDVVDAVSKNVKTDLSFMQMLGLGRKLRGNNLEMTTAPGAPKMVGGVWYYVVDEDEFQAMLASFKSRQEVPPEKENEASTTASSRQGITVVVLNGSGKAGLAKSVADALAGAGYPAPGVGNAESRYETTTVYYSGDGSAEAGLVASDLAGASEPRLERSDDLTSGQNAAVVVVLGSDYEN